MKRTEQKNSRVSTFHPSSHDVALAREEVDHELLSPGVSDSDPSRVERFLAHFSPSILPERLLETLDATFVLLVGLDEEHRISYVIDHAYNEEETTKEEIRLLPAALNKEVGPERYRFDAPALSGEISESRIAASHFLGRTITNGEDSTAALFVGFLESPSPQILSVAGSLLSFSSCIAALRLELHRENEKRKIIEDQLRRAQKLSNVGKLASGIAHDFNNLLTVIQGHAALLELQVGESERLDEKSLESLGLIISASQQAVDLTKQLLLFGHNQPTKLEVCDLNSVVTNFVKMIRRMVEESIEIEVLTDDSIGSVKADKSMIGQILMNLIINARDAIHDGGHIKVKTSSVRVERGDARSVPAGQYVGLTVTDDGVGMSPRLQDKIFDPFYSTKGKGKGTGLGLANVASIVSDHNGHIDVTSKRGKGTTFEILIPAVVSNSSPSPSSKSKQESREELGKGRLANCKVLLVEDESAVRKLVRKLLEMLGCQVIEAASGKQALELWPSVSDSVSVVITDVVMPEGVSGWDLAKELHGRDPDLGILLTSGYNERPEDHGLADEASIAFLQKPYEASNLEKTLTRLLELKKALV